MCALDDILPGFLRLSPDEQRHLTGIMLGIGKKDLPKGRELKDNHSIIHKTLLMAVQSQHYRKPKVSIGASHHLITTIPRKSQRR